jgi:hypothetical protein
VQYGSLIGKEEDQKVNTGKESESRQADAT